MRRALFIIACSLVASAALAQPLPLRKGVSVQMASSVNSVAVPDADQPDSLIVAVTRNGSVYLEVTKVTAEELGTKLREELAAKPGRRVYLKVDARTALSTMAEVLNALRAAGVVAPVILTNQEAPVGPGGYLHPYGQEVWLGEPQGAPTSKIVRIGPAEVADEQLKARAQREKLIVLQIEGVAEWGGVVRAADICRGAGAKVYLSSTVKQK
ncbi:MAG: biopolymer transporter ExbD [Bryobacteraceae bacterium]|nr:biopolymer transporter ExbD [Bryobacteraceae bacterium]